MKTKWPQPDFLAQKPRRPVIVWVWSVAGLAVAAIALGDWSAVRRDLEAQRERLARATQRTAGTASRPRMSASASSPASELDARRAARAVVDRIAHPWDRILANVEAETPDGLQWLEFAHDADDANVRLEGAAADVPEVLRFVDNLAGRAGWSDVVLGRLRIADGRESNAAGPRWHFELHAGIDAHRIALARPAGAP